MSKQNSQSIARIASIVAVATLISKVFGLVREQAIAAAFGVGPVVNAYAYAYVIPGFLLILLGGINGPFHSALVSVLAKQDRREAAPLVETVTTLVTGVLLLVTVVLIVFADTFIDLLAPGLAPQVKAIAVLQLRIMSPVAMLAGLIGIGFGTLNASDQYWLPSISPLFSSLSIVAGVGLLLLVFGEEVGTPAYWGLGAVVMAGTTLAGAVWQWLAQLVAQSRAGMGSLRIRFDWQLEGVKDVLKVMAPATLSSGMLQINVYTDLFFLSAIAGAAAALRYANFIVLTPVGIVSNMILVPFLPVLSRLAAPEQWPELKIRIRQGLMLSALTMLPLTAIFVAVAKPIVRVIYEHGVFDAAASQLVAPVLVAYGIGTFFYLGRDVLVRVFYALGDGNTPFKISIANIFLNAILDYLLVSAFEIPGIVLATVGVNIISMAIFLFILNRRLGGLPLAKWGLSIFTIAAVSAVAGLSCWGTSQLFERFFGDNLILLILQLGLSVTVALLVFSGIAIVLKLPEVDILAAKIRQKLKR